MNSMFSRCSSLNKINLANFNFNNVTNLSYMFSGCSSLKEIELSNFNINYNTNMNCMFYGCSNELKNRIRACFKNIKKEAFK